jgi:hypothetical protein
MNVATGVDIMLDGNFYRAVNNFLSFLCALALLIVKSFKNAES